MRTGDTLSATSMMMKTTTTKSIFSPQAATVQHCSPWHSPVPYLLGGLAAMLGLIILALVILACSYWKHSVGRSSDNAREGGGQRDLEFGDDKPGNTLVKAKLVFEEKIVVIMAGDLRPSFLATPMSSRASSFGDVDAKTENKEKAELIAERPKQETGTDENNQTTIITTTDRN
ncbi:protein GLUTAMINE DUMPER 2-like [Cornus florida]|uniref:protein GLUTAMINE DUMPER 2-like n=1 Tax=Cornus florida TaxID=4283 RepID=UPI00289CB1B4|nr:protein GLUTAMINE DUMPER 2-like [Cornus florida]